MFSMTICELKSIRYVQAAPVQFQGVNIGFQEIVAYGIGDADANHDGQDHVVIPGHFIGHDGSRHRRAGGGGHHGCHAYQCKRYRVNAQAGE